MNIPSSALLFAGSACLLFAFAVSLHSTLVSRAGPLWHGLSRYEARLERHTAFLMWPVRGSQVARLQALVAGLALVFFILTRHAAFAISAVLALWGPPVALRRRHAARVAKLEGQLDTWLLMLANALKATPSLGEAIASTVALAPAPFRDEIDLLVKEIRLGVPLDRALRSVSRRTGSAVISAALSTIVVARKTGGDLPRTLDQASAALRESARLEGVLRAKTAEGRGQVFVLAAIPFVLCLIIAWLDPTWFEPMLGHPNGQVIVAVCSISWAVAVLWAHYIMQAEL